MRPTKATSRQRGSSKAQSAVVLQGPLHTNPPSEPSTHNAVWQSSPLTQASTPLRPLPRTPGWQEQPLASVQ